MAELEVAGLTREQARRQAQREFGSVLKVKEDSCDAWQFHPIEQLLSDAHYAVRQFTNNPLFAIASIVSLTLGIGATTAVFSVIYGVLLHPFPYAGAERMVSFRVKESAGYDGFNNYLLLSALQLKELQASPVIDGAIATDNWDMATTGEDLPQAVHVGKLSANAFEYFGVRPILGREFLSSDGLFGRQPERVLVLSYRFWKAHYAGDLHVIGKVLQLDRENYTIIGVLPATFAWFHQDVYIPMNLTSDPNRVAMVNARLRSGVTPKAAEAGLYSLIQSFQRESPAHFPRKPRLVIRSINSATEHRFRGPLLILFAAVFVLLLVGIANVGLLLMARATSRQHEFAMRSSLGADRLRILQQLFVEALVLAAIGCLLGVGLAYACVPLIIRWLPAESFPNEAAICIRVPVLVFSSVVSLVAALACGLWPAFSASHPDLSQTLQANTPKTVGTRTGRHLRMSLIAAQVALTFILLAGSGSAIRTFLKLYLAPLGYDPSHLLTIGLQFPDGTHLHLEERQHFYSAVREAVAQLPGILSAAIYPFGFPPQAQFSRNLEVYDQPTATNLHVNVNPISREFFETLRIPLLQGSVWSEQQTQQASSVALVNQTFARRYYPKENPIGKRIRLPDFTAFTSWMLAHASSNQWLTILGVVGDTPNEGLSTPVAPAVYVPYSLVLGDSFNLAIRSNINSSTLLHSIRETIHHLDAAQPVNESRTAESILSEEGWATEKFIASLFLLISALALALAAIGLFSVVSFLVARQYQEFGVRIALGASRRRIISEVLLSGTSAVAIGLVVGCVLCALVNRQVHVWTNGSLYDPVVMVCVPCVLLLTSILASLFPAWKAGNVDPMAALRQG